MIKAIYNYYLTARKDQKAVSPVSLNIHFAVTFLVDMCGCAHLKQMHASHIQIALSGFSKKDFKAVLKVLYNLFDYLEALNLIGN